MNLFSASLPLLLIAARASAADRELVRVNGTPIRESEVVERLLKRYGQQTVDDMIDDMLVRQAAKDAEIKADDAEIERRIKKLEAQVGDRAVLIGKLEQAGRSLSWLKEDLADKLVLERLVVRNEGLKVDDAAVKKAFEDHKDSLGRPEAVHLRHIVVATKEEADDVAAKIRSGADFTKLAQEKSLVASGKTAGGDDGFVARGLLPSEIESVAFALKAGEVRAVASSHGFNVIQALETRPARPAVYSEVKDDLRQALLDDQIKKALPHFLQELRRKADIKPIPAPAQAAP
jgi:parvulin-like peptidyl-prolyl isomerase